MKLVYVVYSVLMFTASCTWRKLIHYSATRLSNASRHVETREALHKQTRSRASWEEPNNSSWI